MGGRRGRGLGQLRAEAPPSGPAPGLRQPRARKRGGASGGVPARRARVLPAPRDCAPTRGSTARRRRLQPLGEGVRACAECR